MLINCLVRLRGLAFELDNLDAGSAVPPEDVFGRSAVHNNGLWLKLLYRNGEALLEEALVIVYSYGADRAAGEFEEFVNDCIDASLFGAFSSQVMELVSEAGGVKHRLAEAVDDPCRFMAIALLEAVKNDNRESHLRTVWNNGTGSLCSEIGDLFSHGFGKPRKIRQIVVISVDAAFTTEVTWGYESLPAPLISPKTIHGQWLARMEKAGVEPDEISDRIESSLRRRAIAPVREGAKEYPIGTVAVIPNAHAVFYLLAIARLDDGNNAHASRDDIECAVDSLLSTYDREGQGLDLFVPLLGTGMSRAGITLQESFDLISHEVIANSARVHGRVTIVVSRDDAKALEDRTEDG